MVREIRAAAPLMSQLSAPATARGPWLTAAVNATRVGLVRPQLRAVVVEAHHQGRPSGAALLSLRRRGATTEVRLLGDGTAPPPPGGPPRRLLAADPDTAGQLAAAVVAEVATIRGPWRLALTGLPLGDPTAAALAARLGTGASFATVRSRALHDELDDVGDVQRSCDAAALEQWLPDFLDHRPAGGFRPVLRALVRTHAAIGLLEHAVVRDGDRVVAGLLTLLGPDGRRPWWGWTEVGGLDEAPGRPLVSLTASSAGLSRRR